MSSGDQQGRADGAFRRPTSAGTPPRPDVPQASVPPHGPASCPAPQHHGEADDGVVWLDDEGSTAVAPPERNLRPFLIGLGALAVAVILAVVIGIVMKPSPPDHAVVGFDQPPLVVWSGRAGGEVGGSVVAGGRWLEWNPEDPSAGVALVDMISGEELWRFDGPIPEGDVFVVNQITGTEKAVIASQRGGRSEVVVLELSDGSVVGQMPLEPSMVLGYTDIGRPVVWEWGDEGPSIAPLGSLNSEHVLWRAAPPSGAETFVGAAMEERDGFIFVRTPEHPVRQDRYAYALSATDGGLAPWLTQDDSYFEVVGDSYLVALAPAPLAGYEMRTPDGEVLWEVDAGAMMAVVGGRLYLVDATSVIRLDPATGDELWGEPAEVSPNPQIMLVDGHLLAVGTDPELVIHDLDPATGRIRQETKLGSGVGHASVIEGADKLFFVIPEEESPVLGEEEAAHPSAILMAVSPRGEELWSRTYAGIQGIMPYGRHLMAMGYSNNALIAAVLADAQNR